MPNAKGKKAIAAIKDLITEADEAKMLEVFNASLTTMRGEAPTVCLEVVLDMVRTAYREKAGEVLVEAVNRFLAPEDPEDPEDDGATGADQ